MKKTLVALAVPVALLASTGAFADTQDSATRIQAQQTQIDNAKRFGNALRRCASKPRSTRQAHCTDAGQLARAERKVADKQRICNARRTTCTNRRHASMKPKRSAMRSS